MTDWNGNYNKIFHIHTHRCEHAEGVPDEAYVQKALALGASEIWFTDHAPFPGDPFRNRMRYAQLEEYLSTLTELKHRYNGIVHIGLEIEYFPSYDKEGHYQELLRDNRLEVLVLGQHMAEDTPGSYTFSWDKGRLAKEEYIALGNAVCEGMGKGYFSVLAHSDRIFRRQRAWTEDMQQIANKIIQTAAENNVPLELNMHSVAMKHQYWPEFWESLLPESKVLVGLDAHSVDELERRYERSRQWSKKLQVGQWLDEIPSMHIAKYDKNDLDILLENAFIRNAATLSKTASKGAEKGKDDPRA